MKITLLTPSALPSLRWGPSVRPDASINSAVNAALISLSVRPELVEGYRTVSKNIDQNTKKIPTLDDSSNLKGIKPFDKLRANGRGSLRSFSGAGLNGRGSPRGFSRAGLIISILCMFYSMSYAHQKGVVIVPVADLIGDPISHLFPGHSPKHAYNHLPWSCYQAHYGANGRLHQLLFHEQVTIICSTKHEVCIEVPQVFYTTCAISSPQIRYWTLKKNIMPLSDRIAEHIPPAINFRNKKSIYTPHIAHLLEPWHAKEFGITFSAGTRFVIKSIGTDIVSLYAINPHRYTVTTLSIPKKIIHIQKNSHTQRVVDFISVCRRWAQSLKGDIAYTLGGCSYVQTHKKSAPFTRAKSIITPQALLQYERPEDPAIKTGLDCSNLILRAAQIAGIPYFYKNTHTIERHIRPLAADEQIESGDIIWMPGHVLVVSDAYKGLCIEAHSYDGGYGIVHELPLEKIFKGITSCAALAHALRNKKQLYRLHKNGKVQQVHTNAKVLKLKSLFP